MARLFRRLLALVFLIAWASLGAQVHPLVGSRGLLPATDLFPELRHGGLGFADVPTIFWWSASDAALTAGIVVGVALALLALAGIAPRACFAAMTALYLSYAVVCRTFLSFQWDNLLLECGALAALLPADPARPDAGRWIHALFRVLCFKLYFESGVAKWQSPIGDWHDGSAMSFYYETAPLPTWLAWHAHALPDGWHHLESWLTLAAELVVPFAFFGPRPARLSAAAVLTAFQLANAATANYGFFCWLSVALHVFLLDDRDVLRARRWLRRRTARAGRAARRVQLAVRLARRSLRHIVARRLVWPTRAPGEKRRLARRALTAVVVTAYLTVSCVSAMSLFTNAQPILLADLGPLSLLARPLRLVNTYHLFAQITRVRVEPEIQTSDSDADPVDGDPDAAWTAHHLRYKPGDPAEAPRFVAPHQPRLDFQLWFFGLAMRRGVPPYVGNLLDRVCNDPNAVAGFFRSPLPSEPARVRIAFWRYQFASADDRRQSGLWWTRQRLGVSRPLPCR